MFKSMSLGMTMIAGLIFISGCATTGGRNYQSDIDALNSRITSLQAQLSEKDQTMSKLQNRLGDQQTALTSAESEKRDLANKLSAAQDKLAAAEKKASAPVTSEPSDLK